VAAAALTCEGHAGQVYELSRPRALTWSEAARSPLRARRPADRLRRRRPGRVAARAPRPPACRPTTPALSGCSSRSSAPATSARQRRRRARARPPGDVLRGLGRPRGRRPARPRPHAGLTTHRASTSSAHR
jgi:hypothetical protein